MSDSIAMETPEETLELQLRQLSLPVYLCAVIDSCLNALGEEILLGISRPLLLLDQASRLLRALTYPSIWTSPAPQDRKVAEHFLHSLKATGNRILYHAKRSEKGLHDAKQARLVVIGLSKVVFTFLDIVSVAHVSILPGSFRYIPTT